MKVRVKLSRRPKQCVPRCPNVRLSSIVSRILYGQSAITSHPPLPVLLLTKPKQRRKVSFAPQLLPNDGGQTEFQVSLVPRSSPFSLSLLPRESVSVARDAFPRFLFVGRGGEPNSTGSAAVAAAAATFSRRLCNC